MLNNSDFYRFYGRAKLALEQYAARKEVDIFLQTTFSEIQQTQSLQRLKETLQLFCKQMTAKVNSVGLTAFGGTCTSCPCLKQLKSICAEMTDLLHPQDRQSSHPKIKKSP